MTPTSPAAVTIETSRFGSLSISEAQLFTFPEGLLGFSDLRLFTLIPHGENSPFQWLQSLEEGTLAFPLANPFSLVQDFSFDLSDADAAVLELEKPEHALALAIITVPPQNTAPMTLNLQGPVVINIERRRGKQVVLSNQYPLKWPLQQGASHATDQSENRGKLSHR